MRNIRVFLADDHAVLRAGLQMLIETQADMSIVGQVDNGQEAVEQAKKCQPDVIIMDITMPGSDGVEATKAIQQAGLSAHVLVLTRHSDPGYLRRLLGVGATGYVLKKTAADELINAIRCVAAGGVYIDPSLAEQLVEQLSGSAHAASAMSTTARYTQFTGSKLSDRETEVLRLIAWGYSNKEIATQLGISVKTVEFHKAGATQKLHLYSRAAIVRYALIQGWLQVDDNAE